MTTACVGQRQSEGHAHLDNAWRNAAVPACHTLPPEPHGRDGGSRFRSAESRVMLTALEAGLLVCLARQLLAQRDGRPALRVDRWRRDRSQPAAY